MIGGLIAENLGTVTDSFWDTETSEQAASAGGTGKTTVEMKTKSTFTDATWDFILIWGIRPAVNDGYPNLSPLPKKKYKGNINIDQLIYQRAERMFQ